MTSKLTPPKANIPVGRLTPSGDILPSDELTRFFYDLVKRAGGTVSQTNVELTETTIVQAADISELQAQMTTTLTATYDAANRIATVQNQNGASLAIDETLYFDINYFLTEEEIVDSRRQNGPTINLTARFNEIREYILAKFPGGFPNPAHKDASMAATLHLHHSYLIDGWDWHPCIRLVGDSFRDTILVQSDTPDGHFLRGLARNGQTTGARSPYAQIENLTLLGSNTLGPGNMVTHGLWLEDADQDPLNDLAGAVLAHNGVIGKIVAIVNFSGAGFYCPRKRHGPKWRESYFQGNGKYQQTDGIALLDGTGNYSPNVFDNSDSDAEYSHCGNGGGGGDSYYFANSETVQINGGDCWASVNAALGYLSFRFNAVDYFVLHGVDINGKVYINGSGTNTPSKSTQARIFYNNFRFRKSSFGTTDDDGTPADLDSYIEAEDAPGVICMGNTFTPYYEHRLVVKRPTKVYLTTGSTTRIFSYDRFPALDSNDWPAGDIAVPPTLDTLSNGLGNKLILCAGYMDDLLYPSILMSAVQFIPGGGIFGQTDGTAVTAGTIGENAISVVGTGAPVSITTGTNTNVTSLTLQPGVYEIDAAVQFQVGSGTPAGTLIRMGLGSTTASITTTSPATFSERQLNPALTLAGAFDCLRVGPVVVNISVATKYYSVARCNFAGGTVQALGSLNVKRIR